jgi:hypothetical protein
LKIRPVGSAVLDAIAATPATAARMFVSTNIDDAVVLTVLNVSARSTGGSQPVGDLGRPSPSASG